MVSRQLFLFFFLLLGLSGCKKRHNPVITQTTFETALLEAHDKDGNLYTSLQLFKNLAADPNANPTLRAQALNNCAVIHCKLGDNHVAEKLWLELRNNDAYTTPELALYNLGLLAFDAGNYEQSAVYFKQALEHAPHYTDAYFYSGLCACALQEYTSAKKYFNAVLKHAPNHETARYMLELLEK